MEMTNGKNSFLRLKRVLLNDKDNLPNGLMKVLRADLDQVLSSYFDYPTETLKVDVDLDSKGRYCIRIEAMAERVKTIKVI
ncbi:MAG: cell division topological specificity factor MinE [Clostridia bacterium]|nr:cell division topological specificity factor MinE [Clostridia bacterium]